MYGGRAWALTNLHDMYRAIDEASGPARDAAVRQQLGAGFIKLPLTGAG